jgi:type I restriction enzyme M protein
LQSAIWSLQSAMSDIVQKLWGFCHTLRHDGVDYGDYIE